MLEQLWIKVGSGLLLLSADVVIRFALDPTNIEEGRIHNGTQLRRFCSRCVSLSCIVVVKLCCGLFFVREIRIVRLAAHAPHHRYPWGGGFG